MSSDFLDSRYSLNLAAKYYDLQPNFPDDNPFYLRALPSPNAHVLELGCGTGRVLIPLSNACGYIHGLDSSEGMLTICQEKLRESGIPSTKAVAEFGDITDFDLGRKFDLIIAPFRVFQNLDAEDAVDGLLRCVRNHLLPDGTCILNAFMPNRPREQLLDSPVSQEEEFVWETEIDGKRLTRHDKRSAIDPGTMVLRIEMIYRLHDSYSVVDETVFKAVLRCYYPEEFLRLFVDHGFTIVNRWGGYDDEPWGKGPELVVQFKNRD